MLSRARLNSCGTQSDCGSLGTQEEVFQDFAGMVPMDRAWQDWIMNTQRREGSIRLAAKIGRLAALPGSRLLRKMERRSKSDISLSGLPARNLPAAAGDRTAPPAAPDWAATNSLHLDRRNQQPVCYCFGSPPLAYRAARPADRPSVIFHSPAVVSRFHPTLPWAPAAMRRTERYDGKRDLYFQHAA